MGVAATIPAGAVGIDAFDDCAYRRGYSHPSLLKPLLDRSHKTLLHRTVATALSDHVLSLGFIAAALLSYRHWPPLVAALVHASALLVTARCQRGLENLAHEGSHYNWTRRRKLNDFLADGLVALPIASRVKSYRAGHALHHRRFGTSDDPDLQRYAALTLEAVDRSSIRRFVAAVARRLPAYTASWWRSIGTAWHTAVGGALWHVCFVMVPVWLATGAEASIFVSGTWMVAFVLVLPVLRLIAESNEHVYSEARTVFDATVSNLGICNRLVIHPHNDGFHTVHHLWPRVPHHQLAKLHAALLALDPDGYGRRLRYRTKLLQRPVALSGDLAGQGRREDR